MSLSTLELKPNVMNTKFDDFVKPKINFKEALKALKPIESTKVITNEPKKELNLVLDENSFKNKRKIKDNQKSFIKKIIIQQCVNQTEKPLKEKRIDL